jgi:hypothetical protein
MGYADIGKLAQGQRPFRAEPALKTWANLSPAARQCMMLLIRNS